MTRGSWGPGRSILTDPAPGAAPSPPMLPACVAVYVHVVEPGSVTMQPSQSGFGGSLFVGPGLRLLPGPDGGTGSSSTLRQCLGVTGSPPVLCHGSRPSKPYQLTKSSDQAMPSTGQPSYQPVTSNGTRWIRRSPFALGSGSLFGHGGARPRSNGGPLTPLITPPP